MVTSSNSTLLDTMLPVSADSPEQDSSGDSATTSQQKVPLREEIMQILLKRIVSGELEPGSRLTESKLAEELGVSRTPLREALFYLERDGFVRSDMAKGFSVSPLSAREVREAFPILEALETLALRSLGPLVSCNIEELRCLNQAFAAAAGNSNLCIEFDAKWHETLLNRCPNQRLLSQIQTLKQTILRYEHLYMVDPALVAASVQQHNNVMDALEANDLDAAIAALEENWRFSRDALLIRLGEPQ